MNETKRFIMNERISYLYDKLDFQDAIINKQILEISQLQQKIDKAIEEINYMITNADITEISAIKLKQILGDKENE